MQGSALVRSLAIATIATGCAAIAGLEDPAGETGDAIAPRPRDAATITDDAGANTVDVGGDSASACTLQSSAIAGGALRAA